MISPEIIKTAKNKFNPNNQIVNVNYTVVVMEGKICCSQAVVQQTQEVWKVCLAKLLSAVFALISLTLQIGSQPLLVFLSIIVPIIIGFMGPVLIAGSLIVVPALIAVSPVLTVVLPVIPVILGAAVVVFPFLSVLIPLMPMMPVIIG